MFFNLRQAYSFLYCSYGLWSVLMSFTVNSGASPWSPLVDSCCQCTLLEPIEFQFWPQQTTEQDFQRLSKISTGDQEANKQDGMWIACKQLFFRSTAGQSKQKKWLLNMLDFQKLRAESHYWGWLKSWREEHDNDKPSQSFNIFKLIQPE